jgi:hypothetical protein
MFGADSVVSLKFAHVRDRGLVLVLRPDGLLTDESIALYMPSLQLRIVCGTSGYITLFPRLAASAAP